MSALIDPGTFYIGVAWDVAAADEELRTGMAPGEEHILPLLLMGVIADTEMQARAYFMMTRPELEISQVYLLDSLINSVDTDKDIEYTDLWP